MCKVSITDGHYELVWKSLEVGEEIYLLDGNVEMLRTKIANIMSNTSRFKAVYLSNGLSLYIELYNSMLNANNELKCYVLIIDPIESKILYKFIQNDINTINNLEYSSIRDLF